jgi:ActR/RegA family two-component response regulator
MEYKRPFIAPRAKHIFLEQKQLPNTNKWHLFRSLAREQLSISAQLKIEWIIGYHTMFEKNAAKTARHFGISRKTLHKWLNRFNEKT